MPEEVGLGEKEELLSLLFFWLMLSKHPLIKVGINQVMKADHFSFNKSYAACY